MRRCAAVLLIAVLATALLLPGAAGMAASGAPECCRKACHAAAHQRSHQGPQLRASASPCEEDCCLRVSGAAAYALSSVASEQPLRARASVLPAGSSRRQSLTLAARPVRGPPFVSF